MDMKIEPLAHPFFSVSSMKSLMDGYYKDKKSFYEVVRKISSFKTLKEEFDKNRVDEAKREAIPKQLLDKIKEETKTNELNVTNDEQYKRVTSSNEPIPYENELQPIKEPLAVVTKKLDDLCINDQDDDKDSVDEQKAEAEEFHMDMDDHTNIPISTQHDQASQVSTVNEVERYVQSNAGVIKRQICLSDGRNKRPAIAEVLNEKFGLRFEANKIMQNKTYEKFSIIGKIEFLDKMNAIALLARRTSEKKEISKEDEFIAQCYMELTGFEKCLIAYSIKTNDPNNEIKPISLYKDLGFQKRIIERLNEITCFIRSLTKDDFKSIYKMHNNAV